MAPGLSRRELEVAALVADGLTDKEIARRLFLSERTAEGHVQSIRNKLGFDTRAQIASWHSKRSLGEAGTATSTQAPGATSNLPIQLTSFVGREAELAEVRRLQGRARLVTIAGPGGAGKTRLAVQSGEEMAAREQGDVWFVDLGPVTDPEAVLQAIAAALSVRESESAGLQAALTAALESGRHRALLILDNCEHLIDRCATVADQLLRSCRQLRILATSREPLLVAGEAVCRLASLSLPSIPGPITLDTVRRAEAAQLFCDRAGLSEPGFELTESNASEVGAICLALDGLPLALELAAAQVGILGLEGVATGLSNGGAQLRRRGGPPRHQSLEAAVSWSYDLLAGPQRRLLRALSIFRGGFDVEAAGAVCEATADQLRELADRSLLVRDPAAEQRWRMLETIRQSAAHWLRESGELELVSLRHVEHFAALATRAEPNLVGSEQQVWLERLGTDHDNLRSALAANRDRGGEHRLDLPLALYRFWAVRGHLTEGRAWLEDALATKGGPDAARAGVLNAVAGIAWRQGDYAVARARLEASLEIRRRLADPAGIQPCLANLGVVAASQGDFGDAATYYRESLELAEAAGEERGIAVLRTNLGLALVSLGDEGGAESLLNQSLATARSLEEPALTGQALINVAILKLQQGWPGQALPLLQESLGLLSRIGAGPDLADCLEKLGWAAAAEGDPARALRLAAAAAGLRKRIGAPGSPSARDRIAEVMARARNELGADADQVWSDGLQLTVGDAIELGRQARPD